MKIDSKRVESFPIDQLKQETKEVQNKQLSKIGKFRLIYDPDTQYKALEQVFKESGLFDKVVNDLNQQNLNLPVDLPIIFTDCEEAMSSNNS